MNGRIFPSISELRTLHNQLEPGEWALLNFLDKNLKKDPNDLRIDNLEEYKGWLIFVQPYLNGARPDIIIFRPSVGAMIFEIKDWNIDNFIFREDEKLCYKDAQGEYPKESPVSQVEYYKKKIIGLLISQIGEAVDSDKDVYGVIKTGVYFHNANTKDAKELLRHKGRFPIIFGNDLLTSTKLKEIVPDLERTWSSHWQESWNDEALFWLKPPHHSLEQTKVLTLSKKQLDIATPKAGHHRVRGVAGSGKTQVLAYRAAKLASSGQRVLILTFNITLGNYIHDMLAKAPFEFEWKDITVEHFHGFCADILHRFSSFPKIEANIQNDFFQRRLPDLARDVLENSRNERAVNDYKFDAILIDEGQDFTKNWYQFLAASILKPERDELVVFCDKRQNIYCQDLSWLDKRRGGLDKFVGDWSAEELTSGIRLPFRIAEIANLFGEVFGMNQDIKPEKSTNLSLPGFESIVIWKNLSPSNGFNPEQIFEAYTYLKQRGHASDTAILLPSHELGRQCVEYFKKQGIESNHVFETYEGSSRSHKMSFWKGDSRLKISTVHSFKGWESLNVILFIAAQMPQVFQDLDSLIYTALTRTKQNLFVFNENVRYWKFGESLKL